MSVCQVTYDPTTTLGYDGEATLPGFLQKLSAYADHDRDVPIVGIGPYDTDGRVLNDSRKRSRSRRMA